MARAVLINAEGSTWWPRRADAAGRARLGLSARHAVLIAFGALAGACCACMTVDDYPDCQPLGALGFGGGEVWTRNPDGLWATARGDLSIAIRFKTNEVGTFDLASNDTRMPSVLLGVEHAGTSRYVPLSAGSIEVKAQPSSNALDVDIENAVFRANSDTCFAVGSLQAVAQCVPSCENVTCGPDGCGGSCGSCGEGLVCSLEGACIARTEACEPVQLDAANMYWDWSGDVASIGIPSTGPYNIISIRVADSVQVPATFDLSARTDPASCDVCVRVGSGGQSPSAHRHFFQAGGSLTIDAKGADFRSTLASIRLEEYAYDAGSGFTKVDGGHCLDLRWRRLQASELRAVIVDDSLVFPTHRTDGGDPCTTATTRLHGADIDAVELQNADAVSLGFWNEVRFRPGQSCDLAPQDANDALGPPEGQLLSGNVSLGGGALIGEFDNDVQIMPGYHIIVYEVGQALGETDEGFDVYAADTLDCIDEQDRGACALHVGRLSGGEGSVDVPSF